MTREPGGAANEQQPSIAKARTGWLRRSRQPLRHEHVEINGHDVEITEDEIGVVELHRE